MTDVLTSVGAEVATLRQYRQAYEERAAFQLVRRLPTVTIHAEQSVCRACGHVYGAEVYGRWMPCRCGAFDSIRRLAWSSFHNPLGDAFNRVAMRRTTTLLSPLETGVRQGYCYSHSWAIPSESAVRAIAALGPVIEMGAGRGYWAWCLAQIGCDVLAFDKVLPPHGYQRHSGHTFHPVQLGEPPVLADYPDRTLLLCWPPYDQPMAQECLAHYRGQHVCYIGEGHGGCTGDDSFHEQLAEQFENIDDVMIPQWNGINDYLSIWRRK